MKIKSKLESVNRILNWFFIPIFIALFIFSIYILLALDLNIGFYRNSDNITEAKEKKSLITVFCIIDEKNNKIGYAFNEKPWTYDDVFKNISYKESSHVELQIDKMLLNDKFVDGRNYRNRIVAIIDHDTIDNPSSHNSTYGFTVRKDIDSLHIIYKGTVFKLKNCKSK